MDTLIYIDDKERLDASAAANAFAQNDVKNRAYINTLGAELALKYLASEDINISDTVNLHNIKKILEETDISDIMLKNVHIDVRVVFDENAIFIPKSHFEYDLTPDIYLVFNLAQDHSHVRFLGFFEPKLINKNNANSQYYFIEKEKLSSPNELINYIKSHHGNTNQELSDDDMENSERIIMSMSDNDVSENDKKYLIKQLLKSAELKDRFIEYENFETLSYKAMNDPQIEKKEIDNIEETEFNEPQDDIMCLETLPFEENPLEAVETLDVENDILPDAEPLESVETQEEELTDIINFDEISPLDDNIAQINIEKIQLDNIELPQVEENNFEDDTVVLDEINTNNAEITEAPQIFEEEILPFEELDTSNVEITEAPQMFEEETVALDELETGNVENTEVPQMFEEETVALDELDTNDTEDSKLETFDTSIFEELELMDTSTPEETVNTETAAESDNIEKNVNTESNTEYESIDSIENVITNDIPDVIFPKNTEIIEENKEEESSFGKNLLENLSDDNIEIENTEQENIADISANDLFNQIDDVLTSSSSADSENIENYDENTNNIINEEDKLNVLYNETDLDTPIDENIQPEEELPQQTVPGAALYNKKSDNKKSIIAAALLLTIVAGGAAFMFLKPKDNNNDIEPIATESPMMPQNEDILANTPEKTVSKDIQTPKSTVKELKNNPQKPIKSELSLNVNRLVWDVPDSLSYSPKMQNYLRTAGKSIKLSLSADLLLATEYAYTNQVKAGIKLNQNGSVQDIRIISSSGSTQIDNIVLQSVKDTLNVVKPPSDEIKAPDFNLNLIIYF